MLWLYRIVSVCIASAVYSIYRVHTVHTLCILTSTCAVLCCAVLCWWTSTWAELSWASGDHSLLQSEIIHMVWNGMVWLRMGWYRRLHCGGGGRESLYLPTYEYEYMRNEYLGRASVVIAIWIFNLRFSNWVEFCFFCLIHYTYLYVMHVIYVNQTSLDDPWTMYIYTIHGEGELSQDNLLLSR